MPVTNRCVTIKTIRIMKRFYGRVMMVALAVLSTMAFTSCDEDVEEAMCLSGEWSGDFGMYYEYRYGDRWYAFDAHYTNLVFYPEYEYATYGYGKQVDFYRDGPYSHQYYEFYWEVRNGVIYMEYPYDRELNVAIRDYRISSRKFSGWIGDTHFELYKLRDFYWNDYYNSGGYGYGWNDYWYWDDYYYSKTRGAESSGSVGVDEQNIRRGNRFMEGEVLTK